MLWHLDGRVRSWHERHEGIDPCGPLSVQPGAGGVMVWRLFSWYTLGLLVPTEHRFNATASLSVFAERVHLFMSKVYPSSNGFFQQDSNLRLVHCTQRTVTSFQSSGAPLGYKV